MRRAGARAAGLRGCAVSTSGDDEEEALRGCCAPVKRNGDLAACNLATDDARGQCIAVQFAVTIHRGFVLGKEEQPIGTASELLTWVAMAERRCGSHEFVFSVVEKGVDEDSGNEKVVRFQGRLVGGGAGGRG